MLALKAEIVCIGTELLLGEIVDTNAAYLARVLAEQGIDLFHKTTVGDNLERAVAALKAALDRADVVLVSGGLGPTRDDLTREAIALAVGQPLEVNHEAMRHVETWFNRMKRPMTDNNRRQGMLPRTGEVIPNSMGTAPGIWVETAGKAVIALPGVPRELKSMMEQTVIARLAALVPAAERKVLRSRVLRLYGIGESAMEDRIMPLILEQSNPTIAPYAGDNEVRLRLTASSHSMAEAEEMLNNLENRVRHILGAYIYGKGNDTLESVIVARLTAAGRTLAVAESCTGGLVCHRLTNVPGSSAVFPEGAVTYDNRVKEARLGVPNDVLKEHGAVSEPVARAMAEGIRLASKCDFGLATTGIAGPGGGTDEKPVGLVFTAVSSPLGTRCEYRRFGYDRVNNKLAFSQLALGLLWQVLEEQHIG